jgi:hypothetical protein
LVRREQLVEGLFDFLPDAIFLFPTKLIEGWRFLIVVLCIVNLGIVGKEVDGGGVACLNITQCLEIGIIVGWFAGPEILRLLLKQAGIIGS